MRRRLRKQSSALDERIQQVKDAIYRCDPLHVQISKIQTAIGRAENTVKNRREQLWRSQEALTKAQDHMWELQRRLEQVTQRKEEDQGYDSMDLQDGPGSWWDADSPGSDDVEEHARESSPHSWRSWGGYQYQYQPPQQCHKSQGAIEDLSTKFAEMQQYIGNITTQYSAFQAEVMLAIQTLTNQQKQSASVASCGPVPVTPVASPQLIQLSQSKRLAGDKADGDDSPRKLMVGADDDDLLIDQLGQPSEFQRDLAQESL